MALHRTSGQICLYRRGWCGAEAVTGIGIPEAKDYAGFPVGGQFLVSETRTWLITIWRRFTVKHRLAPTDVGSAYRYPRSGR